MDTISGKAFKSQFLLNFGTYEFSHKEVCDDEVLYIYRNISVSLQDEPYKKQSRNIENLLNGVCFNGHSMLKDSRSKYIGNFIKKFSKKSLCKKSLFFDFVYSNNNCVSIFRCIDCEIKLHRKPEKYMTDPRCYKCDFKMKNPSIEWFEHLPGIIQTQYNGKEYKIPNTKWPVDGYCKETKTIYEYNGCTYHNCPICYRGQDPKNKYSKTDTKKQTCIEMGYSYVDIFHCQWKRIINDDVRLKEYKDFNEKLYVSKLMDIKKKKDEEIEDSGMSFF